MKKLRGSISLKKMPHLCTDSGASLAMDELVELAEEGRLDYEPGMDDDLYIFTLHVTQAPSGSVFVSGVIPCCHYESDQKSLAADNRLVIGDVTLSREAMNLNTLDQSIKELISHWSNETMLTFGQLADRVDGLSSKIIDIDDIVAKQKGENDAS